MNRPVLAAAVLSLAAGHLLCSQTTQSSPARNLQVTRAELAVPFGTVSGKLIVLGNYLIFVDDDQPAASFLIARNELQSLTAQNGMAEIQTLRPIRDRSGERSNFTFRLQGTDPAVFTSWFNGTAFSETARAAAPLTTSAAAPPDSVNTAAAGAPADTGQASRAAPAVFQAKHKQRFGIGNTHGRLILTGKGLAYEAIDNASDSRDWAFNDIKELKHDNPYELKVTPFTGDEYTFELQGSGISNEEYKQLVDAVTAARARR